LAQAITIGFPLHLQHEIGAWILQLIKQSEAFAAAGGHVLSLVFRFPAQDYAPASICSYKIALHYFRTFHKVKHWI
jgi:hypothetical protein